MQVYRREPGGSCILLVPVLSAYYGVMAILFYTIGFPCSGKSTFARHLSQWLDGAYFQADSVGRALFVHPTFSPAERIDVYQHMDYQTRATLNSRRHVLYDGTLTSLEHRHHLRQLAEQCGTKAVGIWLDLPVEVARHRAQIISEDTSQGRHIAPALFDQYIQAFQVPDEQELILHVDGQWRFASQYRQLRSQLHARKVIDLPRLIQG